MSKTTEEIRQPYVDFLAALKDNGWKHRIRNGNWDGEVLYVRGEEQLCIKWGFFPTGARATSARWSRPWVSAIDDVMMPNMPMSFRPSIFTRDLPKKGLTVSVMALVTSKPWVRP